MQRKNDAFHTILQTERYVIEQIGKEVAQVIDGSDGGQAVASDHYYMLFGR